MRLRALRRTYARHVFPESLQVECIACGLGWHRPEQRVGSVRLASSALIQSPAVIDRDASHLHSPKRESDGVEADLDSPSYPDKGFQID